MPSCGVRDVSVNRGGLATSSWVGVLRSRFCPILIAFSSDMISRRWMANRDIVEYSEEDFLFFELLEISLSRPCARPRT